MSEDARPGPLPQAGEEAAGIASHVAAYRASGAWRADPVRFRFLEALCERMAAQPPAVRDLLEARARAALDDFTRVAVQRQPTAARPRAIEAGALADLNAHIRARVEQRQPVPGDDAKDELASVRRFRASWESGRTLQRLEQALARSPANAGPLNSHALVVRSLALMGDLSVDYLRRFLASAETLQWLEAARQSLPRDKDKAAKAAKAGKPARRRKS